MKTWGDFLVGPSTLGKIAACPARVPFCKYSGTGSGPGSDNPFAKEGTILHRHAENWINRVKEEGDLENPLSWIGLLNDVENNKISEGASRLVRYLNKLKKKKNLIVKNMEAEYPATYSHQSSGIDIQSEIDLFVEMKNSEGSSHNLVIDWKRTLKSSQSGVDSSYSWQIKLYCLMLNFKDFQVEEGILISLEQDCEYNREKKIIVDVSTPVNLDELIENWKGQETRPSRENCGIECPRSLDKNNLCPDADLPSLIEISLDGKLVPFRESNLQVSVWRDLTIKKTTEVEKWGAELRKIGSRIFVEENQSGSCQVRGLARAVSLPDNRRRIEVELKAIIYGIE